MQNIRFEDQLVFTVKSQKPSEHCGYCMTASLQHTAGGSRKKIWSANPSLGGGHGSRLQCGQMDWSNWDGGRQPQGAGLRSLQGPKSKLSWNFFTWVNKRFASQRWVLVPIAPLPLHHTQARVLCHRQREIFLSSCARASHHIQLPQSPQSYHRGGFLCNGSHWISNSRTPVRADSFWLICLWHRNDGSRAEIIWPILG